VSTSSSLVHEGPAASTRSRGRRRRRSSSEPPQEAAGEPGLIAAERSGTQVLVGGLASTETGPGSGRPLQKRRRLEKDNMRSDEPIAHSVSNGFGASSNGSTARKPAAASLNGHSSPHTNGSGTGHTNGTNKRVSPVRSPTYFGHNREEVTRILIQGLMDMGYRSAATSLSNESGYELESASVAAFRLAVLDGQWTEAESILVGSRSDLARDVAEGQYGDGLILAEGSDLGQMLFWIRQQKFLELLALRELGLALMVLRQELTPLHHDVHQLHHLSSLLMCPAEDLRNQLHWQGSIEESRNELLRDLTRSIAPSVMIRDHRLAELLEQVKRGQINNCFYHNTSVAPSLYSDHMCDRDNFPLRTWLELDKHTQEVWYLEFSHDGSKLATASQDGSIMVYETTNFNVLHKLVQHGREVTYVTWSPDDTKLISCALDGKARVWDASTGRVIQTVEHPSEGNTTITGASWAPDSQSFVTSSQDKKTQLCHWSLSSTVPLFAWHGGFRAQDCAISPNGEKLVVIDIDHSVYVFNFHTREEEYHRAFGAKLTSLTISQDSQSYLLSLASGQVHLNDMESGESIRVFKGQTQGSFIIRSCFGGAAENFVLSGSEGDYDPVLE
jgi:WD40 repeat protein